MRNIKPHDAIIFIVFVGTGIFVPDTKNLNTDNLLQIFLYSAIWCSGIYSFYLNVKTNELWGNKSEFKEAKAFDWIVLVLQGACFEILWFLFEHRFMWYAADMVALNITYIAWDFVHFDIVKQKNIGRAIIIFDFLGLIVSVSLVCFTKTLPSYRIDSIQNAHSAMWVMLASGILIYHSVVGFLISATQFKHAPAAKAELDIVTN